MRERRGSPRRDADVPNDGLTGAVPRTPAEWFAAGEAVFRDVVEALAGFGVRLDPALRLVPGSAPTPYYEPAACRIGFGVPDPATPAGRLHWIFAARVMGLDSVDAAVATASAFLPWQMAHEVAHHLRHRYGAPIGNDFVEEQVCNEIALAFVREHPRYAHTLPHMRTLVARTTPRLAAAASDAVGHASGYRLTLGEVLVAEGRLAAPRAAELRRLARALGTTLDALLEEADLAPDVFVHTARARRDGAEAYFNRRYAASLFEYHYFGHDWLRAYLARRDVPTLAAALETHVLTAEWERSRAAETATVLVTALHHPDDALAEAAAEALALAGGVATTVLIEALAAPRSRVQAAVLHALRSHAADPRVAHAAAALLNAEAPAVRASAAAVAIVADGSGTSPARAALTAMLQLDDASRAAALHVLQELQEPVPLPLLARLLGAPAARTRALALRALGGCPIPADEAARAAVMLLAARAVTDADDDVRLAALDCLTAHAAIALPPAAAEAVAAALDDPSARIRAQASEVLRTGGAWALRQMRHGAGGPRRRVACAALLLDASHPDREARAWRVVAELLDRARALRALERGTGATSGPAGVVRDAVAEERREAAGLACWLAGQIARSRPMDVALRGLASSDPAVSETACAMACAIAADAWPPSSGHAPADLPDLLARARHPAAAALPSGNSGWRAATTFAARVLAARPGPLVGELAAELALLAARGTPHATDQSSPMLTTLEKLTYLRAVPVFRSVTFESLRALAEDVIVRQYAEGERVFGLGDPGDTLYVLVAGRVRIEQDAPDGRLERIADLTRGQYFGDVSLFSETPRSAIATALEPTIALTLRREHLLALGARQPQVLVEALRVLSARLQAVNADCG